MRELDEELNDYLKIFNKNMKEVVDIETVKNCFNLLENENGSESWKNDVNDTLSSLLNTDNILTHGLVNNEIERLLNNLRTIEFNVSLLEYDEAAVEAVKVQIRKYGLIEYFHVLFRDSYIGNINLLLKMVCGLFNIIRGRASYIFEAVSSTGTGKSYMQELVLNNLFDDYVINLNHVTKASFSRYDSDYFNKRIVYFGDLGDKNSLENSRDVFDIIKILITEGTYKRSLVEKNSKGENEQVELSINVDSIGAVYSTVHDSLMDESDVGQLNSRTLSFSPLIEDEKELLRFIAYVSDTRSNTYKNYMFSLNRLKEFKEYLKYLLSLKDDYVLNPFMDYFVDVVSGSEVSTRKLIHELELFEAYCLLSYEFCDTRQEDETDMLIASERQLEEYLNNISSLNKLSPLEQHFLQMLCKKGTKAELTIPQVEYKEDNVQEALAPFFNHALEDIEVGEYAIGYDDLSFGDEKRFVKKLMSLYRLGENSLKNVFFTRSDIHHFYYQNKAYKNVSDVSNMLYVLKEKNFLGSLDFKYNNKNIYFLLDSVSGLETKEFVFDSTNFKIDNNHDFNSRSVKEEDII